MRKSYKSYKSKSSSGTKAKYSGTKSGKSSVSNSSKSKYRKKKYYKKSESSVETKPTSVSTEDVITRKRVEMLSELDEQLKAGDRASKQYSSILSVRRRYHRNSGHSSHYHK